MRFMPAPADDAREERHRALLGDASGTEDVGATWHGHRNGRWTAPLVSVLDLLTERGNTVKTHPHYVVEPGIAINHVGYRHECGHPAYIYGQPDTNEHLKAIVQHNLRVQTALAQQPVRIGKLDLLWKALALVSLWSAFQFVWEVLTYSI
jgi:hypothetical protein